MPNKKSPDEVKQVGKFGLIGLLNTGIDVGLYNLLTSTYVGLGLIQGNLVSTTTAMLFSFVANKQFVFHSQRRNLLTQAIVFFAVTAFGLYVLQSGVIKLLTEVWPAPLNLAVTIVHALGLGSIFGRAFIIKNGAKAAATLVSLTWNYLMYKKVVFA